MKVRIASTQYMLRPIAGWADFERQVAAGRRPAFVGVGNDDLPGDLPTDVWLRRDVEVVERADRTE